MNQPVLHYPNPLQISKENPFEKDQLDRKNTIENLTRLLSSTNQPFVLSIEGKWGSGKTTFVQMWKQYLINEKYMALYFNAWENDFVSDPLSAFISEITSEIIQSNESFKHQDTIDKLIKFGEKIIKKSVPVLISALTRGILDQKSCSEIQSATKEDYIEWVSDVTKSQISDFKNQKSAILDFKDTLKELVNILKEDGYKLPLVIFVDELDRCRPDFALSLLEQIKHLFNADNLFFVLSIDREQFENSVKAIYGIGLDSDEYLRRFINLSYSLQISEKYTKLFITFLFDQFMITEEILHVNPSSIIKQINLISSQLNFSLRKIEQCVTELNVIFRTIQPNLQKNLAEINLTATLLVLIKASDVNLYKSIRNGDKEALDKFERRLGDQIYSRELDWGWCYGLLIDLNSDYQLINDLNEDLLMYPRSEEDFILGKDNVLKRILNAIESRNSNNYDPIPIVCPYIDFAEMFFPE